MVGTHEGKLYLGLPRRRWIDNIKLDSSEIGWGHGLYCPAQGRNQWRAFVNTTVNLPVPQNVRKF
jgi:hypothetical protein